MVRIRLGPLQLGRVVEHPGLDGVRGPVLGLHARLVLRLLHNLLLELAPLVLVDVPLLRAALQEADGLGRELLPSALRLLLAVPATAAR